MGRGKSQVCTALDEETKDMTELEANFHFCFNSTLAKEQVFDKEWPQNTNFYLDMDAMKSHWRKCKDWEAALRYHPGPDVGTWKDLYVDMKIRTDNNGTKTVYNVKHFSKGFDLSISLEDNGTVMVNGKMPGVPTRHLAGEDLTAGPEDNGTIAINRIKYGEGETEGS